jgi:hypothetical protein
MILKQPKLFLSAGAALLLVGGAALIRHRQDVPAEKPKADPGRLEALADRKAQGADRLTISLTLQEAIGYRAISAVLAGNGHDTLILKAANPGNRPVRIEIPAGVVLRSGQSSVVVIRHQVVEIGPRQTRSEKIRTAAISAANTIADALYEIAADGDRRVEPVLTHAARHPEVADGAIQTAILALVENLPLRFFAKFETVGGDVRSRFDTKAFRVDTADIISALALLRTIGVPDDKLALTVDPLLKVEAMIDPLAHAAAMGYYHIAFENEWAWWKSQLLDGDPATRHYALFGIARFYPDIAVQMMPKWVREERMEQVFRSSAIQALAETRRQQALSVLEQLTYELGGDLTDLGRTAGTAKKFLAQNLQETRQMAAPRIRMRGGDVRLRPEVAEPARAVASLGLR